MSKKRFVEFYLAAMLKAATGGKVSGLAYGCTNTSETVLIHIKGASHTAVTVTGESLLAIAVYVTQAVMG